MSNYSALSMKGTVTIVAEDANTGEIIKQETVSNTIVRTGRVAITKLITGAVSQDRSYVILDYTYSGNSLFPITFEPFPDLSYSWLGLRIDGEPYLYYIGPLYTSNAAANATLGPITRDVTGFATYLNQLFSAYDGSGSGNIPVYNANGEITAYVPYTPRVKASVVNIDGNYRVKISKVDSGVGTVEPYSTAPIPGTWVRFYTHDVLFGPNTQVHAASEVSTGESDYVVDGLQLGVSNGVTNITDSAFVVGTYTSQRYIPTISYNQVDANKEFDTQAIFEVVIPASESNGEGGLGVVFTEAALLCRNDSWFTHANFGSFYKNNSIRLTIRWTVDCLPQ